MPLPSYDGMGRRYHAMVRGVDASHVRVLGNGSIDGQGAFWWSRQNTYERPHVIELYNCTDTEVAGVTLRDSPGWTLHPVYSQRLHIHHVSIQSPASSPNTDGIDPDSCRDVLIEHCNISCGDDHIAIKSGKDAAGQAFGVPSRNITVQYSTMWAGRGISIGSEVSGGVTDVTVQHNVLYGPSEHGIHIKTNRERGGYVTNVLYLNNTLGTVVGDSLLGILTTYGDATQSKGSKATTTHVTLPSPHEVQPPPGPLTRIANITFELVRRVPGAPADDKGAGAFGCFDAEHPCVGITLRNVALDPVNTTPPWKCAFVLNAVVDNVSPSGLVDACNP